MVTAPGFTAGRPPQWDVERFVHGDELDAALITLERNRLTFAWKCTGVDAAGLRLRVARSTMSLGGLLKHLAWVEEDYFQQRLAGRPSMPPFDALDPETRWEDWPWTITDDETSESLLSLWSTTVHRSRESLSEALADGGLDRVSSSGMNVRRLVIDMIEEYARHTGHADLLREAVDGETGEGSPSDFPVP